MNKVLGYTLIELMVVISVIFILAAMAIPGFEAMRDRAKIYSAKEAMNGLRAAQALYKSEHEMGYYADNIEDLRPYTNVTNLLRSFLGESVSFSVTNTDEGLSYTIVAQAKDSKNTPITGTVKRVYP